MKHAKRPTRRQKKIISAAGYDPDEMLVMRETLTELMLQQKTHIGAGFSVIPVTAFFTIKKDMPPLVRGSFLLIALIGLMLFSEWIAPARAAESVGKLQKEVRLSLTVPISAEIPPEPEPISIGTYTVTAYCPCRACCGDWSNPDDPRTASGASAVEGITVGADWATIAPGTRILISGVGERTVQDKPAGWIVRKYDGRILDLYFESHADALAFGRQELAIYILPEGTANE